MCGISGILSRGRASNYSGNIERMNEAIKHRGPDDEGVYSDADILLGHRRLSIIDLSDNAHQPMSTKEQNVWVVFNGEIYNFRDLRTQLEGKGWVFTTDSDTEVLLHGYNEWGTELFKRLEGMFAFALWDCRLNRLLLVRDACGVKPLFYSAEGQNTVFSSEIKGLLASGLVDNEIDHQSLSNYLSLFYIPRPETIIQNVRQVPPGSYIVFANGQPPIINTFWSLADHPPPATLATSEDELGEQLRHEVSVCVSSSLESDVPISLLLSSGLDSSIVLHELKRLGRSDVKTVTAGFREPSYDESQVADRYARQMGFVNNSFLVPESHPGESLERAVYHLDSLNANPCILAEHAYFEAVSQTHKVALMGSGNDESFAGYPTYQADRLARSYGRLPLVVRRLASAAARMIRPSEAKYSFDYLAQKFTEGCLLPAPERHHAWRTIFSDEEKAELYKKGLVQELGLTMDSFHVYQRHINDAHDWLSAEDKTLYADFQLFLIDNANIEVDQLSMSFSLEARPPFLTKRFVEFAFSIPFAMKLKRNQTKHCLRKAYDGVLPSYITTRKKQGLVSPLGKLFSPDMEDFAKQWLFSRDTLEFFDRSAIESLFDDHKRRRRNNSFKLFAILCFAIWRHHFSGSSVQRG